MDRLGDELLAGAALAGDEHRRVGRRDAADQLQDAQHARIAADEVAEVVARVELVAGQRALVGLRRALAASPSAVCTVCSICWLVHGLVTKSDAPAFMPSTASAIDPHAVIRIDRNRRRRPP